MSHIESLEDLIAVVETAEQRLDAGEEKARRAGDLLVRAENLREEAKARQKEMEEQVAAGEEKLAEARQLRSLVDDETIAQAEALVERIREEDADIIAWLDRQANKSAAIRAAIRQAIQPAEPLDEAALRRVLREELAQAQVKVTDEDDDEASPAITEDVDPEAGQRLDNLF